MGREASQVDLEAERPQVLAQLAKDISELIQSARNVSDRGMPRAESPMTVKSQVLGACPPVFSMPEQVAPNKSEQGRVPHIGQFAKRLAVPVQQAAATPLPCGDDRTVLVPEPVASVKLMPSTAALSPGNFGCGLQECVQQSVVAPGSQQVPSRSRDVRNVGDVQTLLANIESREAALRMKVQQLAEEKAVQQQRLEDEISRLQRSNARMEEELRHQRSSMSAPLPPASGPELGDCYRCMGSIPAPLPATNDALSLQQALTQDSRDELQQQLTEIRAEVARCAQALCAPEALPAAEVADIRQQLAALSSEVIQTSRALLSASPPTSSREMVLADVRRQLGTLQGQLLATDPFLTEGMEATSVEAQLNRLRKSQHMPSAASRSASLGAASASLPPGRGSGALLHAWPSGLVQSQFGAAPATTAPPQPCSASAPLPPSPLVEPQDHAQVVLADVRRQLESLQGQLLVPELPASDGIEPTSLELPCLRRSQNAAAAAARSGSVGASSAPLQPRRGSNASLHGAWPSGLQNHLGAQLPPQLCVAQAPLPVVEPLDHAPQTTLQRPIGIDPAALDRLRKPQHVGTAASRSGSVGASSASLAPGRGCNTSLPGSWPSGYAQAQLGAPVPAQLCGGTSAPAVEPHDHAPQGALHRPSRTKLVRQDGLM